MGSNISGQLGGADAEVDTAAGGGLGLVGSGTNQQNVVAHEIAGRSQGDRRAVGAVEAQVAEAAADNVEKGREVNPRRTGGAHADGGPPPGEGDYPAKPARSDAAANQDFDGVGPATGEGNVGLDGRDDLALATGAHPAGDAGSSAIGADEQRRVEADLTARGGGLDRDAAVLPLEVTGPGREHQLGAGIDGALGEGLVEAVALDGDGLDRVRPQPEGTAAGRPDACLTVLLQTHHLRRDARNLEGARADEPGAVFGDADLLVFLQEGNAERGAGKGLGKGAAGGSGADDDSVVQVAAVRAGGALHILSRVMMICGCCRHGRPILVVRVPLDTVGRLCLSPA
jgi:hypothetical protein